MSLHINAKPSDIAPFVLMPGDPKRAEHIAEKFLEKPICYNDIRGMLGFTGVFEGMRVSIQSTGMGMPSASIYIEELCREFNVKTLCRIGTCGAMQDTLSIRDLVLAQGACTDSAMNRQLLPGLDFAPIADFELLEAAAHAARARYMPFRVGNVFTSDSFYNCSQSCEKLKKFGIFVVEMETAALYTIAASHGVRALSILTVSDHLLKKEATTAKEREETFDQMVELALELSRDFASS